MTTELIPFNIETQNVIRLLAKQIYQSPLAMLRENTHNAFDAIKERLQRARDFVPRIDIQIAPNRVIISDNGIGMTPSDLRKHYWTAGSSSKNNPTARAAGVVGTFGIGAMANFGICESLVVETESAVSGERTRCRAERAKLSLKEDCIESESIPPTGSPGTSISADVEPQSPLKVQEARNYIAEFVFLLDIPVYVNGELISQRPVEEAVPLVPEAWRFEQNAHKLGPRLTGDVVLVLSNNADIWMTLTSIVWSGQPIPGRLVLRGGHPVLRTFRSGFGLATASVTSAYQFGGVADLLVLEPTAGREALTVTGLQMLQSMVAEVDAFTSGILATRVECDASGAFMTWIVNHGRYDLCGLLRMTVSPGDRITLADVTARSKIATMLLYEGNDLGIIKMHASEETPLLVLARNNPRRRCEQGYVKKYAATALIADAPVVKQRRGRSTFNAAESGLAFRVETILDSDYFLRSSVEYGIISHGLPVVVEKRQEDVSVILNPDTQSVRFLLDLYDRDYTAFGSMAKDFVRTVVFQRVADFVPSSTRQGAEAFLAAIRRPRELFEYEYDDLDNVAKIWEDYNEGTISLKQAVERSRTAARKSVQIIDAAEKAKDVVPDVIQNEQAFQNAAVETALNFEASPAITRLETSTSAKLLVIDEDEPTLRGYRCFIAITDKVRDEVGEFFLQPHQTSIIWGGQKTLFIFLHHSGQFGLYYDLQTREPVNAPAGGQPYPTATIVLKDRIFIPIPDEIRASFLVKVGERKRFDVKADIIRTEGKGL